jgi:hypothetical protein
VTPPPTRWTFEAGAEVARARAWEKCEVCGVDRDTQTHHRQPRGRGGVSGDGLAVNHPACLLRVCLTCHDRIERHREWARREGLLVPGVGRGTAGHVDPADVPVRLRTINGRGWFHLIEDGAVYQWLDLPDDFSAITGTVGDVAA